MAIRVVNQKHVRGSGLAVEYVGRWHREFGYGSPLQNQWSHVPGAKAANLVDSRDEAVECYRRWLWGVIKDASGPAYEELLRLAELAARGDLTLCCWCWPEGCHATVIANAIEWLNKRKA